MAATAGLLLLLAGQAAAAAGADAPRLSAGSREAARSPTDRGASAPPSEGPGRQLASHFLVGCLLVMGIYHLTLFAFRPAYPAPLALGLCCLLWASSPLGAATGRPLLAQLELGSFLASVPLGLWFLRGPRREELAKQRGLSPAMSAQRRGGAKAVLFLVGLALLGALAAHDALQEPIVVGSISLFHAGAVLWAMAGAFTLARQFSSSFEKTELLSRRLEATILAQQQEMSERARLENELVEIAEQERRRISHDLHDGLCQLLTGARLQSALLEQKSVAPGTSAEDLTKLSALLDEAVGDAYELAHGMWPIEEGARATSAFLGEHAGHHARESGIEIVLRKDLEHPDCPSERLIQLARIGQEALVNAVRHAKARRIEIALECLRGQGRFRLSVRDDGVGRSATCRFEVGLGSRIMAHRAKLIDGTLSIVDADGGGTLVSCEAPCRRGACGAREPPA